MRASSPAPNALSFRCDGAKYPSHYASIFLASDDTAAVTKATTSHSNSVFDELHLFARNDNHYHICCQNPRSRIEEHVQTAQAICKRLSTFSLLQQSYGTARSSKKGLQEVLFPTHPFIQNNVYPIDQLVGNVSRSSLRESAPSLTLQETSWTRSNKNKNTSISHSISHGP